MSTLLLVVCCLGVGCVAGKRVIREEKNRKEKTRRNRVVLLRVKDGYLYEFVGTW